MPNWSELLEEIDKVAKSTSSLDLLRRQYLADLTEYTGRNLICYYSGFLSKPDAGSKLTVHDNDKNGFMTSIYGLDVSRGSTSLFTHRAETPQLRNPSLITCGQRLERISDVSCRKCPCRPEL